MNNKVTLSNKAIKQMARQMLKGKYWACVFVVLVSNIIVNAPTVIIGNITSNETFNTIASWLSIFLSVVLEYGLACFFIAVFRMQKASLEQISSAFNKSFSVVCLSVISYVQVLLRTFLLIVPGLVRLIKNSQALFVLADNPDMNPDECLRQSQRMMDGNGFKFVGLGFSFLGLSILANVPSMVYEYYCIMKSNITLVIPSITGVSFEQFVNELNNYAAQLSSIQNPLIALILGSLSIFVTAYSLTARVAFYDIASGNLLLATEVDAADVSEDREVVDLDD